jgi:branched-chain amino acid aminotransferase
MPYAAPALYAAIAEVLAANAMPDAAIRITLTRGPAPRGLLAPPHVTPTLLITAAALAALPPPATAIIATSITRDETSPLAALKSVNYLANILARQEAAAKGADDAILLNRSGNLAEATASNLFLIIGGEIITPPLSDGALPGIARSALLNSFPIKQASLTPADITASQAGFLSNALALRPLAAIGATRLDPATPQLTRLLNWFQHA